MRQTCSKFSAGRTIVRVRPPSRRRSPRSSAAQQHYRVEGGGYRVQGRYVALRATQLRLDVTSMLLSAKGAFLPSTLHSQPSTLLKQTQDFHGNGNRHS